MATNPATLDATQPVQPVPSNVSAATASDVGYPHGHDGCLTGKQENALVEFKKLLEERGLYKPGPPASHDDPLLLRYLRARRWVPADAVGQFADTETWRAEADIDTLYRTIELSAYETCRRLYPQWTGRRDRRGIPVYVFEVKQLDSKAVSEYEKAGKNGGTFSDAKWDGKTPQGLVRLFALYENLTRFAMPFCTQLQDREPAGVPITMSTNIVDISGVSLRQFWNLKGHMQAASQLATAHYPETLDRIFVIGAPSFFSTVWGWIKRWFDPMTVSKIFILGEHEVKSTLESFIRPEDIPKRYGGQLDFEFGGEPINDPGWEGAVEWAPGHDSFGTGPMVWRPTPDGSRLECVRLGAVDGKKREEPICSVKRTWPPVEIKVAEDAKEIKADQSLVPAAIPQEEAGAGEQQQQHEQQQQQMPSEQTNAEVTSGVATEPVETTTENITEGVQKLDVAQQNGHAVENGSWDEKREEIAAAAPTNPTTAA